MGCLQQLLFEHIAESPWPRFDSISFREVSGFTCGSHEREHPCILEVYMMTNITLGSKDSFIGHLVTLALIKPERVSDITIGDFWG